MWAVVLVPMWLRRHDTSVESRSVDRFSSAMRVLSPRSRPTGDRRYVVMPRRVPDATDVHVSGAPGARRRPSAAGAGRPSGRAALVARRRRLVLGLAALVLFTFVLAVAGVLGWTLQLLTDLALGGYLVHLRGEAKRAATVSRQRRRATVATPRARSLGMFADDEWSVDTEIRDGSAWAVGEAESGWELPAEQWAEVAETGTDGRWDPVPVPRPTYQLKPPAPSRPIVPEESFLDGEAVAPADDDATGTAAATRPAHADVVDADDWDEIDDILARRRAVND
jgi:hypothetical protein